MRSQLKRKYRQARSEFKRDFYAAAKENPALAMLMITTYTANQHRSHIMKIWELLGHYHREAYKDYCDKLFGKHLSGRDEVWKSLHFAGQQDTSEVHQKNTGTCSDGRCSGGGISSVESIVI